MEKQLIYTVSEVCKLLKINRNLVYKLIHKGHLKAIKIGNLKVTGKALEEFLNDHVGLDFSDLDNVVEIETKEKPKQLA